MLNGKKVGIALGSGSARGWAHIGVLKELHAMGIEPDVIAGCSVGSFVGAIACMGYLDEFEDWVLSLNWREVWGLLDVSFAGGLVRGDKLLSFFRESGIDRDIEEMPCVFGAVATELSTGQEHWLRTGKVLDAVRASCTFPGLFRPVSNEGRWMIDGGLVNPVPVSLCRALGADIIIAVDLNTHLVSRHAQTPHEPTKPQIIAEPGEELGAIDRIKSWFVSSGSHDEHEQDYPGIMEVMAASINIMQDRITRSRMAGDPPDILLSPRVMDIGMMDFDRARDAIHEGHEVVKGARERICHICGIDPHTLPDAEFQQPLSDSLKGGLDRLIEQD
ncbi:patatin-like phospholipase RssA [Parendozoicomonas haliclonae]|uniref:NTE family protein RssA n=1 Tax=Parendozoicomonas haliclonae TaxID=1960125 RepID=A0A1X7AF63_9GAMM|nr:patatin-like phospholipase RssA [Parendozoicomonas haliclonae]SMA34836.1 NTE family protein RssA [Parendozoicomonas haliclonae]